MRRGNTVWMARGQECTYINPLGILEVPVVPDPRGLPGRWKTALPGGCCQNRDYTDKPQTVRPCHGQDFSAGVSARFRQVPGPGSARATRDHAAWPTRDGAD